MEYVLVAWVVVSTSFCGMVQKDWKNLMSFKTVGKENALDKCEAAAKELDLSKFKCIKV